MDFDEIVHLVGPADALIVVPPFCEVQSPALGAHILQACAREAGFRVRVLYANMLFSRLAGRDSQETRSLETASSTELIGERLFARAAFGVPPLGRGSNTIPELARSAILTLESRAARWATELGTFLGRLRVPVIGFTTTFQQTAPSVALANAVKLAAPSTVVIIGGANCDGEMAYGIARAAPTIDFVFQGESEATFPRFLSQLAEGQRPRGRVIAGAPCIDMDALPLAIFDDYVEQKRAWLVGEHELADAEVWLPYESSRGCWWGERHHCTFCGLNALGMSHREKSSDLVIGELRELLERYPFRRVMMTDNIMPHTYFKTLVPELAAEPLPCEVIFYEQKANLTLAKMVDLWRAGVRMIQPGVEALSTPLLQLMDKGVKARQNVAMLRYARIVGVLPIWNLLYDFPGDDRGWYEDVLELLPLLRHLHPPQGLLRLSIDRFSPYFDEPRRYGLSGIRPLAVYRDIVPSDCDSAEIAYYFTADYESAAREPGGDALFEKLRDAIDTWREEWTRARPPVLTLSGVGPDEFTLLDTRALDGTERFRTISRDDAVALLTPRPLGVSPDASAAIEAKLGVALDGYYVPLVVADRALVQAVESGGVREPMAGRAK